MNRLNYTTLQYRYDRSGDEAVNIGVLAFAPELKQAFLKWESSVKVLSVLYKNFDSVGYRQSMKALGRRIDRLNSDSSMRLFSADEFSSDSVEKVLRSIWPDPGGSIVGSGSRVALSDNPEAEVNALFDRFVQRLRPGHVPSERREDNDVWLRVQQSLSRVEGLAARFHHRAFDEGIELDYVYEQPSGEVVAVEPIAFDYLDPSSVKSRTYQLVGVAAGLESLPSFSNLYVVVGESRREPEIESTVNWAEAYIRSHAPKTTLIPESQLSDWSVPFE